MFDKICSFQNLHLAYFKARKGKRYRKEILEFSYNLEGNLLKLQRELLNQTYKHGSYREFIVCDAKKRQIKAAPFRDRVVHHAVCNIIEPIFDKGFIYDSYACRAEKGTHKALKRLRKFLRLVSSKENENKQKVYILQCDISKYFDNIRHETLLEMIEKKIFHKKTMWLIKKILYSSYGNTYGKGIPIGNLTSQLFANIYLNEMDQFVKHQLRIKYFVRYMDDFLILGYNKKVLHKIKKILQKFLWDRLNLVFHPKKANVFLANNGVDFLGYRNFRNYRLLRKSTIKRFVKRTKIYSKKMEKNLISFDKFKHAIQSWIAYAQFANSQGLLMGPISDFIVRIGNI